MKTRPCRHQLRSLLGSFFATAARCLPDYTQDTGGAVFIITAVAINIFHDYINSYHLLRRKEDILSVISAPDAIHCPFK